MVSVFVEAAGLCGPGLNGWDAGAPVLAGRAPYIAAPFVFPPLQLLASAERRRMSPATKLALAVGYEALIRSGRDAGDVASVFASSGGDGETIHAVLEALATPGREVSPTRFHNSVHNAPSGYWAVATSSRAPSTTLCAHDGSFAAGLLEAAVQAATDRTAVLLLAYDIPYPEPLHTVRPLIAPFGAAIMLAPEPSERTLSRLTLSFGGAAETAMEEKPLEALRLGNPAARALPVLAALARAAPAQVTLAGTGAARLVLSVAPPETALSAA